MLGVSRTPVREAIVALQQQRLVEVVPKRGTFVFKPSAQDIAALVEYRRYLELAALQVAFQRAPKNLMRDLGKAAADMERRLRTGDQPGAARADAAFHGALVLHAGNTYLQEG